MVFADASDFDDRALNMRKKLIEREDDWQPNMEWRTVAKARRQFNDYFRLYPPLSHPPVMNQK